MNAEISETMGARLMRFGVQIPERLTQRKFVSVDCHAHSNAHKPPKTSQRKFVSVDCHAHSNAHKPPKTVALGLPRPL